jgi:hypothetical protein
MLKGSIPSKANYLAIGIAAGGAERFLCEQLDVGMLAVIDDGLHPNHSIWQTLNRPNVKAIGCEVKEYIGNSHIVAAEDFLDGLGEKFDLISIDGDHSFDGVRMDFELAIKHAKPGALMWFHDVNLDVWPGARDYFKELSGRYPVLLHTNGRCGIGVVQV